MSAAEKTIPTELGTKKISTLLKEYAVPGIIAMTAVSLYNMVDSIFIGHIKDVGSLAISGLAVTFPFMNLATALGTLIGIGTSTMISILLGQGNQEMARKVFGNQISMSSICSIAFTIISLLFLEPILYFFGASPATMPYAKEYMVITLIGMFITNHYFGFNNCIRAAGNPKLAMKLTIFTVLCNSALDPLFIFTLDLGVKGAAIATLISQVIALAYSIYYTFKPESVLKLSKKIFRIKSRIAKDILSIGMGPFLMNSASCIVSLFINQQLRKYGGDLNIGAFGIVNKISFLFTMVITGFIQGMQPIAGYNFGSRQYGRMKEVYKYTALWATVVSVLCFFFCTFLPRQTASIFTNDPELLELSAHGLFITNICFIIVGFQMVTTTFFQCIGMVRKSIVLSVSRQLLFLVPLLYILPLIYDVDGIWYSFPVSDLMAALLTIAMMISLFRKLSRLKDGEDPSFLGGQI